MGVGDYTHVNRIPTGRAPDLSPVVAIKVLVALMETHEDSTAVLRNALWAISNLIAACDTPDALDQVPCVPRIRLCFVVC